MKRFVPLLLTVALLLCGCGSGRVDSAAIDDVIAQLEPAEALYDAGDWLGAARAFKAMRDSYDAKAEMNYNTAMAYRERVLLPLYEWMGLPEGERVVDWEIPWSGVYYEDAWKKRDRESKINAVSWGLDAPLKVMYRNSLYQYYREQADAGRDVAALDESPYVHDRTWWEFTKRLCMKHRIDRADVAYRGGKKLMVENHEPTWTWQEAVLRGIAPMDLAVNADEVGYILRIDEKQVPLNVAWVNKKTGNVVKGYYRSDVTVFLDILETGETIELCSGSATPDTGPGSNFYSNNVGRHSLADAIDAVQSGAYPVLERYLRVYTPAEE